MRLYYVRTSGIIHPFTSVSTKNFADHLDVCRELGDGINRNRFVAARSKLLRSIAACRALYIPITFAFAQAENRQVDAVVAVITGAPCAVRASRFIPRESTYNAGCYASNS